MAVAGRGYDTEFVVFRDQIISSTQTGILPLLLSNTAGNLILAYCILMIFYAVWAVAIDRR